MHARLRVQVGGLKQKISESQGHASDLQKLIFAGACPDARSTRTSACMLVGADAVYAVLLPCLRHAGKILADEKTVEDLKFREGKDFIVVMVSKVCAARCAVPARDQRRD